METTIGCVIVTYNRLEKLKKTLSAYASQTLKPLFLIVVDNASTDQTAVFLNQWQKIDEGFNKIVIHSNENLGGSGGFYIGEKEALKLNSNWIMIADDDAYPEKNYLYGIQSYIDNHDTTNISILCGKVSEHGIYESIHRSAWRSKWDRSFHCPVKKEKYNDREFYPDFVSYIGIVINKEKMKKAGLVCKDNFIWCDDTEHTYRLSLYGKIICLPEYTIIHDVDLANHALSWKSYYGYRNDLVFFKKHFKTHFPFIIIKLTLKTMLCPLHGKSLTEVKLRMRAIYDAIFDNMGINSKYKPGWKPK